MARSLSEENQHLKQTLQEKNILLNEQTAMINRHIEALYELKRLKEENNRCRTALLDAENEALRLEKENEELVRFRAKILTHPCIRVLRWLRRVRT